MKNNMRSSLISASICLLAIIYSARSQPQCCDSTTCEWSTTSWKSAPNDAPNLDNYPDFDQTKASDNYLFIEDATGNISSSATFHMDGQSLAIISYYYFVDSSEPLAVNNKLQVYFESGESSLLLSEITIGSSEWRLAATPCDITNAFCCPTGVAPCDGTIKFSATVDPAYPVGLFAADNIGIGCIHI